MQIIKGSRNLKTGQLENPVITLGNFDGVHRGHQKILRKVIQRAEKIGGVSVVYTFDPHPLNVLRPDQEPPKITTFEEKAKFIESYGIDYLVCEHFTKQFAQKSPEEFIEKIIVGRIRPREIVIGHDYAFGKSRQGSIDLLEQTGTKLGYKVHVINDITIKNIPVRSTTIRNLISAGKVSLAQKLMGREYCIAGKVIHGKRRRIGFPTANLSHIKDLIPQKGIYAIRVDTPYGMYGGIVNIGHIPTFGGQKLSIEAHLFDFDNDIYGREIAIHFVKRIRDEKKFDYVPDLVKQIQKDISRAKSILAKQ